MLVTIKVTIGGFYRQHHKGYYRVSIKVTVGVSIGATKRGFL